MYYTLLIMSQEYHIYYVTALTKAFRVDNTVAHLSQMGKVKCGQVSLLSTRSWSFRQA